MVTGATGFIGSRVVQKLLQNETAVKILALPGEAVPAAWAEKIEIVREASPIPGLWKRPPTELKPLFIWWLS